MNAETVLVTGASSGIGLELAHCFATDGCRLVLVARNRNALETLAAELRSTHRIEAHVFAADLAEKDTPVRLRDELQAAKLDIDILVNNAGFGAYGSFAAVPIQRQVEMIQVNVTGLTELTWLFLRPMMERRRGGILNVASTASFQPGPGMAVYYATKAFVLSFTEAIAEELKGSGVVATAVCPGPTETNFASAASAEFSRLFRMRSMSAEAVARIGHRAFRRGKVVAVTGFQNGVLSQAVRFSPRWLVRKAVKRLNATSIQ